MGVDLGGFDASMAEQLLQQAQVRATRVHVGGKGMPQHMWRDPLRARQPCGHSGLLDLKQSCLARQGLCAVSHRVEQPLGRLAPRVNAGQLLPLGNGLDRTIMQRHKALLVTLAAHQQHPGPGRCRV